MGLSGKEPGGGARPSQAQSELDKGFWARPLSPFLPLFPPFPPSPSWTRKGGNLLQLGVGILLLLGAPQGPAGLPLAPLYTGAGGHPTTTQVDLRIVP